MNSTLDGSEASPWVSTASGRDSGGLPSPRLTPSCSPRWADRTSFGCLPGGGGGGALGAPAASRAAAVGRLRLPPPERSRRTPHDPAHTLERRARDTSLTGGPSETARPAARAGR